MITTRRRGRSRGRDDRGLVLLLVALMLTFLLVLVAMAVDLGQVRSSRRELQAAADVAALDAGFHLSGRGSPTATALPRQACAAAAQAIARNLSGFAPLSTSAVDLQCAGFPATGADCNPSVQHTASFSSGRYRLRIVYPMSAASLAPIGLTGVGVNDGTKPCERLGVDLDTTEQTSFARVIGIDQLQTGALAVVRARFSNSTTDNAPPAFLLLERTDCGVLGNSVGGAGNEGVVVEPNGTDPGVIHVDTNATTNCSGSTQNAYAIYGSSLSSGQPSITVKDAATGPRKGIIATLATNGRGGATFPGGLSTAVTNAPAPVSRKPVDDRYNTGTNTAVSDLHTAASSVVRATGAPPGFTSMGCAGPAPAAARIYVDCAAFNATTTFVGATHVTFSGNVDLKQSNVVRLPDATDVVVRGRLAVPQGRWLAPAVQRLSVGGGVAVGNGSGLAVNSADELSCVGREPPATWTNTTKLTIFGGDPALEVAGNAALCQTTVYLAGPATLTTYSVQQTTSGGSCSSVLPCPRSSGNVATGARFMVSGAVRWSAPNQHPAASPPDQGLEDLAYWTEGAGVSEVRSGGSLETSGVFAAPNARLEMRSPATGSPQDAQFIARSLFLFQGSLRMKPAKANSITIRVPGGYSLIR